MARYTDIDKLIAEYDRIHVGPAGGARKLMVEAPIADVVPRAEVAREIFEEIEKTINRKMDRNQRFYEELKSRESKLSIWGYKDMGYFQGIVTACDGFQELIDELKKKYTEVQK